MSYAPSPADHIGARWESSREEWCIQQSDDHIMLLSDQYNLNIFMKSDQVNDS